MAVVTDSAKGICWACKGEGQSVYGVYSCPMHIILLTDLAAATFMATKSGVSPGNLAAAVKRLARLGEVGGNG